MDKRHEMHDMEEHQGTPWLSQPVMLHSDRTYTCSLNETTQCEWQQGYWRFWYEADHRYALPTVAFFLATILFFALVRSIPSVLPHRVAGSNTWRKIIATTRWLSYRTFRIPALNWNSAPLGVLILAFIGAVYFLAMTLGPQPYYWPNTSTTSYGNSPPLATRAGWLSIGCMPFVFATAGKSNLITLLTGVPHEKLQVFHRWISYAFFVTALVHTFPFIIYHIWQGDMAEQWRTSVAYWTGVVALLAQAYLTFASMGPLRNLSYELFKQTHYLAALLFTLFFLFHCDFILTSADYFIATATIFTLTWLHRHIRIYFEHGLHHHATLTLTPSGFIEANIPTRARWRIGQHFFVRFLLPHTDALASHPFTACSLPSWSHSPPLASPDTSTAPNTLTLLIRPRAGLTARLAHRASTHPHQPLRVLLDGPYGGLPTSALQTPTRSLVIAGGSGAGWTLPLIEAHARRLLLLNGTQEGSDGERPALRVMLVTREEGGAEWFEGAVGELLAATARVESEGDPPARRAGGEVVVEVDVHHTGSQQHDADKKAGESSSSDDDETSPNRLRDMEKGPTFHTTPTPNAHPSSTSSSTNQKRIPTPPSTLLRVRHATGRPNLSAVVADEARKTGADGRLGVFLCGPLSMQNDVANAVAGEQGRVVRAGGGGEGGGEVFLHMEHFSWA